MSTINDGGPAFPVGSGDMRDPVGMSLRDYFATHCVGIDDDCSVGLATLLAATQGVEKPGGNQDVMGWHRFWCAAHAAHRYMMADVMLAARKADPQP